ncbi:1-phosphofructokinase family hexose kinase [Amycolatopsis sp. cg5]|uniref:1-phosphofructokinase family hexose kinase n=1 Tax=Amycolatopsis sp. cg5 TaxID=3238802 RepID=UPI0035233AD6
MIVTVTPNAALDVTYTVDSFRPGETHRVRSVRQRAGGKGVNVARVLHALGADVRAIATIGGRTGHAFSDDLAASGIPARLVPIAGETRRTTTVLGDTTTLLNEPGPEVTQAEWAALDRAAQSQDPDVLVCSGSLPPGCPADGYATLLSGLSILDTSGDALLAGLKAKPTVVKPNLDELREVTGLADTESAAAELRKAGAGTVIVSLGKDGMLAVTQAGTWHATPTEVLTGNPTGAGDAAVAAIALGLLRRDSWPRILRDAVALSAAAVRGALAGDVDLPYFRRERDLVSVHPS